MVNYIKMFCPYNGNQGGVFFILGVFLYKKQKNNTQLKKNKNEKKKNPTSKMKFWAFFVFSSKIEKESLIRGVIFGNY